MVAANFDISSCKLCCSLRAPSAICGGGGDLVRGLGIMIINNDDCNNKIDKRVLDVDAHLHPGLPSSILHHLSLDRDVFDIGLRYLVHGEHLRVHGNVVMNWLPGTVFRGVGLQGLHLHCDGVRYTLFDFLLLVLL